MAYQKLQATSAWQVVPSDYTNIPQIFLNGGTGTVSSSTATSLTVTGANFFELGVKTGMIVVNVTTGVQATVAGVNQSTNTDTLPLSGGTFAAGNTYQIDGGDNNGCVLYIGTGGDVRVTTAGGHDVTFTNLASGSFLPVQVVKVWSTSTLGSDIIALW